MPTLFVGVHLGLSIIVALFGLSFIADPCGGGGDLCLGGAVGLFALGVAGFGAVGIVIWSIGRRASPLLVLDCAMLALAGSVLLFGASGGPPALLVGGLLGAVFSLIGAVLAGKAVMMHRIEPLLAVAALVLLVAIAREAGVVVLALGLVALAVGWPLAREDNRREA